MDKVLSGDKLGTKIVKLKAKYQIDEKKLTV